MENTTVQNDNKMDREHCGHHQMPSPTEKMLGKRPAPPETPKKNSIHAKSPKMMFRCQICAADSIYHYYGVQSCEGCKQFFRRIIVKQKDFKCWKTQKCEIEKGERCRSCRLDKCLLMGMDPKMVNIHKTPQLEKFIEILEKRRAGMFEDHRQCKLQKDLFSTPTPNGAQHGISHPQHGMASYGLNPPSAGNNHDGQKPTTTALLQPTPIPAVSTAFQPYTSQTSLLDINTNIATPVNISFKMLDSLMTMENCLKKIWFSSSELPQAYIERHADLAALLRDNKNLLAQANQFSSPSPSTLLSQNMILEKAELHGFFFPEHMNSTSKDRFLCIEMAKGMPFFNKLTTDDQIALLRHIVGPVTMFINAFYSHLVGADTWTRSNGFTNITLFGQSRFANDDKIATLSKQMLCESVDAFKKADIGREEFILLMAILFSSSTASDLSAPARELLYDESVRHSKALLDLLQLRHGHVGGSQKYAVAIELLSQAFHFDYRMHLLSTYTRAMHRECSNDAAASIFPKI